MGGAPADAGQAPEESGGDGSAGDAGRVELLLRSPNPNKAGDLRLVVGKGATVGELKDMIRENYEGHPAPSEQVLIHAGKVLKESGTAVGEVLKGAEGPGPFSMHLVIQGDGVLRQRRAQGGRGDRTGAIRWLGSWGEPPGSDAAGEAGGPAPQAAPDPAAAPGAPTEAASGWVPHHGPQIALVPSGTVALPCMMMSPVVTAAYNAAMATISGSSPEGAAAAPGSQAAQAEAASTSSAQPAARPVLPQIPVMLGAFQPGAQGQGAPGQAEQKPNYQGQQTGSGAPPLGPPLPAGAPLIPAIAFFPLGVPVLVPPTGAPLQQALYGGQQLQPPPNMRYIQLPGNRMVGIGANGAQQPRVPQANQFQPYMPMPNRGARRRRVLMFRISIRGLLQLVLVLTFLYNYCTKGRFYLLLGIFVLLYLLAGPLRMLLSHVTRGPANSHPPSQGEQNQTQQQQQQQNRPRGFVTEVLMLLVGFVTSLLPTWNINAQDEAAFAAAQEMVMGEVDREGANGNANNGGNGNEAQQDLQQAQPAPQGPPAQQNPPGQRWGQDSAEANHRHQD